MTKQKNLFGYTDRLGDVTLAQEERPANKLLEKGRSSLTNIDLLAMILSSGKPLEETIGAARKIMVICNGSLIGLARMSYKDLIGISSVGPATALRLLAAMEFGKRRAVEVAKLKDKISSSKDIYNLMSPIFSELGHEEFWAVLISRSNHLVSVIKIGEGGLSGTVADPKKIFTLALADRASSIILCHNHPSGNVKPSEADIALTKKMVGAGKMLDLPVLDHLIIANGSYFSFADEGML